MASIHSTRIDWFAHAAEQMNAQRTASRDAVSHAFASSVDAACRVDHPAASVLAGARAGMGDLLAYLQGFARLASHVDLTGEIERLAAEVNRDDV